MCQEQAWQDEWGGVRQVGDLLQICQIKCAEADNLLWRP